MKKLFWVQSADKKLRDRERDTERESASTWTVFVQIIWDRKCIWAIPGSSRWGTRKENQFYIILYNSKYVTDKLTGLKWYDFQQTMYQHAALCYHLTLTMYEYHPFNYPVTAQGK